MPESPRHKSLAMADTSHSSPLPRYEPDQTYQWNYNRQPQCPRALTLAADTVSTPRFSLWGHAVQLPVAVAAGPLLNGAWVDYYAQLGFDVLTYKTVRSRQVDCYDRPNLQPVVPVELKQGNATVQSEAQFSGSWAVSFGMPSREPGQWRADLERLRARLAPHKLLSVSVVATPEPDWNLAQVAEDYARCARWAAESGADMVEVNLSCPNVRSCDGQLYLQGSHAAEVAARVRTSLPATVRLLAKIGWLPSPQAATELWQALAPQVDALVTTNCLAARVVDADGKSLFDGQGRGIAGAAIRRAVLEQLRWLNHARQHTSSPALLIGCGGIATAQHVQDAWDAGADFVQVATAAMVDPLWARGLLEQLRAE